MNDRELLELAARAAGLKFPNWTDEIRDYDSHHYGMPALYGSCQCESWNPLEDDGDALRLAVNLDISVFGHFPFDAVAAFDGRRIIETKQPDDPMPATRRAIVRAAAAIGQAMK